jgi:hypothetical protein
MGDILKKELPDFPVKLNLYDFTVLPRFTDSDRGKVAIETHETSIRKGKTAKTVTWLSWIGAFLILFIAFNWLCLIYAMFGWIIALIFTLLPFKAKADAKLQYEISEHCREIAQYVVENYFHGARHFYYFTEVLIYNNDVCAWFSTDSGEFVIYNKTNIKEVNRERVHVGTQTTTSVTTTSSASTTGKSRRTLANSLGIDPFNFGTRKYKGSTTGVSYSSSDSYSKEIYEWHFNIFTDFIQHPNISMVLPDGKIGENETGNAYGVLKP